MSFSIIPALNAAWAFVQTYGWFVVAAVVLVAVARPRVEALIASRAAAARMREALEPSRVALLDEERRRVREEQQRELLAAREARAAEEAAAREAAKEAAAAAAAELRAAGNPQGELPNGGRAGLSDEERRARLQAARDAGRGAGGFMQGGGGGGAHRFGADRRKAAGAKRGG